MTIRAKFPLPHAGQIIPAGATADLPDNLARMLVARGQAEEAAATAAVAQASLPASPPHAPVSATPRAEAPAAPVVKA